MNLSTVLLAAAFATALGGCSDEGHLTARYTSRHVDKSGTSVEHGAFDWTDRRGWISGNDPSFEYRQVGDDCYQRFGNGPWEHTRAEAALDGYCSSGPPNPKTDWRLMRSVASKWKRVGTASIGGVSAIHYRSRVDIGGVRGDGDWWIDGNGRLRRLVTRDTRVP
ncbi:MAG: hypothetical protein ACXVRZ_10525 [Gaiellaceae bacterium]